MSLQVWLPLNGDLHNQGLTNVTVTNSGATLDDYGKIGKCYSLNGTNNYLALTNINCQAWSQCSIAFWCYPTAAFNYAFLIRGSAAHRFRISGDGLMFRDSNNSTQRIIPFNATIGQNIWHHIACTYNRGEIYMYIDGIQTNHSTTYYHDNSVLLSDLNEYRIGRVQSSSADNYYTGKINDFRIYNHALSPKEVEEIAKGLVLHYKLDGENQIVVPSGYQQLEYLESTGTQYINTGKVPQDTYEYRFKYALTAFDAYKGPFSAYSAEAANTVRIIPKNGSNTDVFIYFNSKAGGGLLTVTGLTSAVNQIVEGSLSKKSYYLKNITSNIIKSDSNATDLFPTKGTAITANMCLFGYSGYISQSRIYYFDTYNNGTCIQKLVPAKRLSDNVLGMYDVITKTFFTNAGTGTFTAGPNASITGTVYDCSGYSNNGTIVGSLTAAAGSPRYDVATQFHGSAVIKKTDFIFNSNVWTVSLWYFKPTNPSAYEILFCLSQGNGGDSNKKICAAPNSGRIWYKGESGSASLNQITINAWCHLVMTCDGTTVKIYKDGDATPIGSFSASTALTGYTDLVIGARAAAEDATSVSVYYAGKLSDFRIYATALTPNQIKELYNTSMSIDSNGNVYARELVEL